VICYSLVLRRYLFKAKTMNPAKLIEKAKTSSFYLWLLNWSFDRMIPFNRPHGFKITEIGSHHVKTRLPYKTKNLNHLKGLHACALATLTEITGGFIFVTQLDPSRYRIILKKLEVDYLYQGKTDATAEFRISETWMEENVIAPLRTAASVEVISAVNIQDEKGNKLTQGRATWQIKSWDKVKTKA
jgi:acyl-coenzyme A thioesterase PaaI-like protein